MEEKIKAFKQWLNLEYAASQKYGEPEETDIWEQVIDKFNKTF